MFVWTKRLWGSLQICDLSNSGWRQDCAKLQKLVRKLENMILHQLMQVIIKFILRQIQNISRKFFIAQEISWTWINVGRRSDGSSKIILHCTITCLVAKVTNMCTNASTSKVDYYLGSLFSWTVTLLMRYRKTTLVILGMILNRLLFNIWGTKRNLIKFYSCLD